MNFKLKLLQSLGDLNSKVFVFLYVSVDAEKQVGELAGIAVGATVMLNILIAG